MKKIDKPLLIDASQRLMFVMTDSEYDVLTSEFDVLLKQMALIGKISGVDALTPMTFPFPITTLQLRDDVSGVTLTQKQATENAKQVRDGQIKLPKVVG